VVIACFHPLRVLAEATREPTLALVRGVNRRLLARLASKHRQLLLGNVGVFLGHRAGGNGRQGLLSLSRLNGHGEARRLVRLLLLLVETYAIIVNSWLRSLVWSWSLNRTVIAAGGVCLIARRFGVAAACSGCDCFIGTIFVGKRVDVFATMVRELWLRVHS
jgi:hypothetical protein